MLALLQAASYHTTMSKSARAEALIALRESETQGTIIEAPADWHHLEPDTPEAFAYLEDIKPLRFANLAQTMSIMLEHTQQQRAHRPPDGLLKQKASSEWFQLAGKQNPWVKTYLDFIGTTKLSVAAISTSESYAQTEQFTHIVSFLNPKRKIAAHEQLMAGNKTASITMLTLLGNLPGIIEYHADMQPSPEATAVIARESISLPRQLAKLTIGQLLVAEAGLAVDDLPPAEKHWEELVAQLDPARFVLRALPEGKRALAYADLQNIETVSLPIIGQPRPRVQKVKETDDPLNRPKIGCPITLLQGHLQKLWDWHIDVTVQRNLWNYDFPQAHY